MGTRSGIVALAAWLLACDRQAFAPHPAYVGQQQADEPADHDGDRIADDRDRCPTEKEDLDGHEDADGCPDRDNDHDGIPDPEDSCADQFGLAENRGCPKKDRDGDGIADADDSCPDERGLRDLAGCRKEPPALLTPTGIVTAEEVGFRGDTAALRPASRRLLNHVAAVILGHPELSQIRVEVRTVGKATDRDKALAQHRAEAVKQYLVNQGVFDDRLLAAGVAGGNDGRPTARRHPTGSTPRLVSFVVESAAQR